MRLVLSIFCLLFTLLIASAKTAASEQPVTIGTQKQLFIDDYIIGSMDPRVYRLMNQPVKHQDNPVIRMDKDWEHKGGLSHGGDCGQVFYDPDRKMYRFYGMMVNWDWSQRWIFYAESKDGLHWIKPPLGQVQYLGYDTNFLHLSFLGEANPGNVAIFPDPNAQSEEEQYKIIFQQERDGKWGMYPGHSPDGIHFKAYDVDRPVVPFWSDTNNNLIWDYKKKRYILYLRSFTLLSRWMTPESFFPEDTRTRTAAFATSTDFLNWDSPSSIRDAPDRFIAFHTDEKDRPGDRDFYTLEVLPYEGGYVGFTSVYHNMFGIAPAMDEGKAQSPWMEKMDVQLLWSRNGEQFERVGDRRVFIPNGPPGSWDEDMVYSVHNGIVREDLGEIWIYYEGFRGHHWFYHRQEHQKGQVGLAVLRLDGFVSVTGQGALTTRSLRFEGRRLKINATGVDKYVGSDYGTVRVEILDAETGKTVPGFGLEDSDPFGGDEIKHTVTWKGRSDLALLQDKAIQLRFHLDKAKLFSFSFSQK